MKKYLNIHILNSSLFIILVANSTTFFLSKVPFLEPINDSVTEWDFTDLYYKTNPKFKESKLDSNIVIVNFGHLDRAGIAKLLDEVNTYNPKVVGLNARFSQEKESVGDSLLEKALYNTKNLVMFGRVEKDTLSIQDDGYYIKASHERFARHGAVGMNDLIPGENDVIRSFFRYEDDNMGRTYSFPIEILRIYKPSLAKPLIENKDVIDFIKYQGNMTNYYHVDFDDDSLLQVYNLQQNSIGWTWIKTKQDLTILNDKIVLFGFIGRNTNSISEYVEDLFNSPMRSELWSLNTPDMYAVAILANILSMYLNEDTVLYYHGQEGFYGWMILVVFLITIQLIHIKFNTDNQMIDRLMALFVIFILIFSSVKLFGYGIYLNFTLAVFWLLFATDANELYLKLYKPIVPKLSRVGRAIFMYTPLVTFILLFILLGLAYFIDINKIIGIPIIAMLIYLLGFLVYGQFIKWQQRKVSV